MRVITVNLFTYEELTEEGQQRAIKEERERRLKTGDIRPCEDEDDESIKKIARIFGTGIRYYNDFYGFDTSNIEDDILGLSDNRALAYIYNNYYPTRPKTYHKGNWYAGRQSKCVVEFDGGYYMDYHLIHALKDFQNEMKADHHPTIADFIKSVGDKIRENIEFDIEYFLSDKGIRDDLIGDNYPIYLADGEVFGHRHKLKRSVTSM